MSTLILEGYTEQNVKFLNENGIKLLQFGVVDIKENFGYIPEGIIAVTLIFLLDKQNDPILIH
jgi:tyrosine-protein phosphatase SIW14